MVQPLRRRRERRNFAEVAARLAKPQLLHHANKGLRNHALNCLEEVVRICKLENDAKPEIGDEANVVAQEEETPLPGACGAPNEVKHNIIILLRSGQC